MIINWEEKLKDKNIKVVDFEDSNLFYIYSPETDKFYVCIEDLIYDCIHKGISTPKYAYGTDLFPFQLKLDSILNDEAHDHHEDILDNLDGVEELIKAIDEFNNANKRTGSYEPDYNTIVKLF